MSITLTIDYKDKILSIQADESNTIGWLKE